MTEEEAETKWCPMVRVVTGRRVNADVLVEHEGAAMNRVIVPGEDAPIIEHSNCIGSACMMWRWYDGFNETMANAKGYCGLSGKP